MHISISLTSTKKVLDAVKAYRLAEQNNIVEEKRCGSNKNKNEDENENENSKDASVEIV